MLPSIETLFTRAGPSTAEPERHLLQVKLSLPELTAIVPTCIKPVSFFKSQTRLSRANRRKPDIRTGFNYNYTRFWMYANVEGALHHPLS